jgi:hypothetical protein
MDARGGGIACPMLNNLLTSVFGSRNERLLKQLSGIVKKINALEPQMQALSDDALKAKTEEFKARSAKGESLDKLLPEAFAVCREASVRVLGMRHYDVQLIGGMVLHGARSPKCAPARARPWSRPCRCTSTRWKARACTWSPSTTTWPAATPRRWASCTTGWA